MHTSLQLKKMQYLCFFFAISMTTGFVAAIRKEFTRRAQSASTQVQDRMAKAEKMLQEHVEDQKAINAGEGVRRAVLYTYTQVRT